MTTPELTAAVGDAAVKQVFDTIAKVLLNRGSVAIDRFGEFALCQRAARAARNPRTGERITVPARVVAKFTPAAVLNRRAAKLSNVPRGS